MTPETIRDVRECVARITMNGLETYQHQLAAEQLVMGVVERARLSWGEDAAAAVRCILEHERSQLFACYADQVSEN